MRHHGHRRTVPSSTLGALASYSDDVSSPRTRPLGGGGQRWISALHGHVLCRSLAAVFHPSLAQETTEWRPRGAAPADESPETGDFGREPCRGEQVNTLKERVCRKDPNLPKS